MKTKEFVVPNDLWQFMNLERDKDLTATKVYEHILNSGEIAKEFTYIILGRSGPTGKTRLLKRLLDREFKAFEITESIFDVIDYTDANNHFIVDPYYKKVVIVLNNYIGG